MTSYSFESPIQIILAQGDALALTADVRRKLQLLDIDFRSETVRLLSERQLLELDLERTKADSRSGLGFTAESLAAVDAITTKLRQAWLRASEHARSALSADQLTKLREGASTLPSFDSDLTLSVSTGLDVLVTDAVAARLKDAKVVEVETAQAIAERLLGWAKTAATVAAIPLALFFAALVVLGISKWTDFRHLIDQAISGIDQASKEVIDNQITRKGQLINDQLDAFKKDLEQQITTKITNVSTTVKDLEGKVDRLTAPPLNRFPVDRDQVSVSGFSSGAFMANQLHVAHSAEIIGAAMIAGGLYGCAVDSVRPRGVFSLASLAVGPCQSEPSLLRPVDFYAQLTADLASKGWIDGPSNLAHSRVYMFTGQADKVVSSKAIELGTSLYRVLGVPASQVKFRDQDLPGDGAGHSWVTKNFGNACDANAKPFMNNCNYDQAGEVLETIYGRLQPAAPQLAGHIVVFDQTEFAPGQAAAANGLLDKGYLYVPKACEPGAAQRCRLHVALHGCLQSAEVLSDEFFTRIGVNEWADTNRIVVLYPQAHATTVSELSSQNFRSLFNTNLAGCWNWWGYGYDDKYLTKEGVQIKAIWSMVKRITGQDN